jgi:hypothetical protein
MDVDFHGPGQGQGKISDFEKCKAGFSSNQWPMGERTYHTVSSGSGLRTRARSNKLGTQNKTE